MATLTPVQTVTRLGGVRERIVGIDKQVPLLDGSHRTYVNFDNTASTPILRDVKETVDRFLEWYSSVHRGAGFKSHVATRAFEDARQIVAAFVGADLRDHTVIFGKNTTEAMNKLARRFPFEPGDVVLVSLMEHHSNDLPWRAVAKVVHVGLDERGALDEADFDRKLAEYQGRVKLVAITGASNVTGIINPVHRLAAKAHAAGAQIAADCAQLAPHRRIQMGDLSDPEHLDYVALSAHKMYAPLGTGTLIGRRDTFARGEPDYRGGGTIDIVTTEWVEWAEPPDRDEAGSPNVVGAVALAAAMQALDAIGMDAIAAHEAELTAYALERMARIPGTVLYGDTDPACAMNRLGVIPFNLANASHFLVGAILGTEYGIGVRNGCFCAHPYVLHLLDIDEEQAERVRQDMVAHDRSTMPGLVRASFGMYNTAEEVDALIAGLEDIAAHRYRGEYVQDRASGDYHAVGWTPDFGQYFLL
jgi:selenocysteine lyase/cysteine desulfurase